MSFEEAGVAMAALMATTVEALVDRPADVCVVLGREDERVTLTVSVAPCDMGRVIGVGGRTARSLRTILSSVGGKYRVGCQLVITGEQGRRGER